jgi:1-acyl-sn-glycerol-3-phosphate acyltransferase
MRTLLKPLQFLYVIYAITTFALLMVPVFLWALVVSMFGRIKGGNLVYQACIVWADLWFFLIFIRHRNEYIQKPREHQSYIFVVNHISYLDSAILPKTFRHPVRPLGKVEMVKIPVFGTIYKNAIVTVDRSNTANRARSVQVLKSLLSKEISILVFPEGTFNTTGRPLKEFYDGAFRIAIETGTPIKPVLFLYTYDRMHYASVFSLNPGKSRSVFLPEIAVDGLTLNDVATLRQKVFQVMEEELVKRGASWIGEKATTQATPL